MICPECSSSNLNKNGWSNGRQRYKCNSCGRHFVEGTTYKGRSPKTNTPKFDCPYCGSPNVLRSGLLRSGKQRFICQHCKKSFSSREILTPVEWKCPYCESKLKRAGKSKTGKSAYFCTTCGKTSYGDPPVKSRKFKEENTKVKCPYCKSLNLVLCGTSSGTQRYRCKDCGRYFNDRTEKLIQEKKNSLRSKEVCPRCGSKRIINAGTSKYGKLRYRCLDCKRSYTKGAKLIETKYKQAPVQDKDKKAVLFYKFHFKISNKELAETFKCSEHSIRQLVREYKDKIQPLTEKQIKRIQKCLST